MKIIFNKKIFISSSTAVFIVVFIIFGVFYFLKSEKDKKYREKLSQIPGISYEEASFLDSEGIIDKKAIEIGNLSDLSLKPNNLTEQNIDSSEESFKALATKLDLSEKTYKAAFKLENKTDKERDFYLIPVSDKSEAEFKEIKGEINGDFFELKSEKEFSGESGLESLADIYDVSSHMTDLSSDLMQAYNDIKNENYSANPIKITLKPNSVLIAKSQWQIVKNISSDSDSLKPVYFLIYGSAGGIKDNLEILNLYSHPREGDNWEVYFKTNGTDDLTITPIDQNTINDLDFIYLGCSPSSADLEEAIEADDYQEMKPQILDNDIIYYHNWHCNGVGKIIHKTNVGGKHTLKFEFLGEVKYAYNSNLYWVGGDGGNISDKTNWSTSNPSACNPGGGDASAAPGSSDVAIFDADCDNGATINSNWSISGININSGYAGTITQSSSITLTIGSSDFIQAGGTFTGGDSTITINDDFTLSGGAFTSTSGILTITSYGAYFTISGGTFNDGSGTFKIENYTTVNVDTTETFNNFTVDTTASGASRALYVTTGDTLVVNGTVSLVEGNLGYDSSYYGTIDAKSTISISSTFDGSNYGWDPGATLLIDGSGDQSFTVQNGTKLPTINLNNSLTEIDFATDAVADVYGDFTLQAGTFTCSNGTVRFNADLTISGGTFNVNNGTIAAVNIDSTTLWDVDTTLTINNFTINRSSGTLQFATGDTIQVDGTLTLTDGDIYGSGILDAKGPIVVEAGFDGSEYSYSGGNLVIDGSGDQSFSIPSGAVLPKTTLNNSLTTISAATDASITLESGFTLQAGTFTCSNNTTTFTYDLTVSGGTFNHNNGTVVFNANNFTITGNITFYKLTFNAAKTYTIANSNTLTVLNDLSLTDGTINQTTIPATGSIAAKGNIIQGTAFDGGTAKVLINGTDNQTFTGCGSESSGSLPLIEIDKSVSGTLYLSSTIRIAGGGAVWTYTSGTVDASTYSSKLYFRRNSSTTTITGTHTLYDVEFYADSTYSLTIASGTTLTIAHNFTISGAGYLNLSTGTINAEGNIALTNTYYGSGGTATLNINGTNEQTITGGDSDYTSGLPKVEINKSNGSTLNLVGYISYYGTQWKYTAGTINAGTSTIRFRRTGSALTITGSHSLYNVEFWADSGYSVTISAGTTLTVLGTLTFTGSYQNYTTGTIAAQGNVTVASGTYYSGSTILTFSGSNTQSFDLTGAEALLNLDIKVNKSGGQVNLASTLTADATNQDLIIEEGTFDLNGNTLSVSGTGSTFIVEDGGNFQLQGGETTTTPTLNSGSTVTYDGTGCTLKDWTYHHLAINGSGTFTFGVDESLGGNFLLTAGTVDFNGKSITTASNFTIDTGGQIISDADAMDGAVITVGGNCDLNGESGDQLIFKWTGSGAGAWSLLVTGNIDMDYVAFTPASTNTMLLDVSGSAATASYTAAAYSDASGGTEIDATDGTNTDNDNNTNWNFGPTGPVYMRVNTGNLRIKGGSLRIETK